MPEPNLIRTFIDSFNRLGVKYMVTGAVASIIYGEPRLTHDIDLVIELDQDAVDSFVGGFPSEDFYCPPAEAIRREINRIHGGHVNLIHHATGFKADIYMAGEDTLHAWALANRRKIEFEGESVWVAPPEYVIVRKLEYYHEGKSRKHIRDIQGILELSLDQIDLQILRIKIAERGLEGEWQKLKIG